MAALAATAALGWAAGRRGWPRSPWASTCTSCGLRGTQQPGRGGDVQRARFPGRTVLRLRREAVDELARRGRELEEERELFAEIALRHERARIASELHNIVGHAISVMVIQAAAGTAPR